ncbi:MAG: FAD:protein FMN transferase [Bacillota bacterium]|nr:FAD:protein FMN transferase [Bacillota bacterium]
MKNINRNLIRKSFCALGTYNTIQTFYPIKEQILDEAINTVLRIHNRMSAFNSESEIGKINKFAGIKSINVSKNTFRVLRSAKKFSKITDGAFDVTICPLTELWKIGRGENTVPTSSEIEKALSLSDYRGLILNEENQSAFLKKAGQKIDLGGIAKGYAADEVKRILIQGGVKNALINLGGNIIALGENFDHKFWTVGIQNPLAPTGEFLGTLSVSNKTIVTSGSNERFFIKDGIRYHHIIDPRTGAPAQSGILSVTLVGNNSMEADALSTAAFVLGLEKGIELIQKYGYEAIFALENQQLYVTNGLRDQFQVCS